MLKNWFVIVLSVCDVTVPGLNIALRICNRNPLSAVICVGVGVTPVAASAPNRALSVDVVPHRAIDAPPARAPLARIANSSPGTGRHASCSVLLRCVHTPIDAHAASAHAPPTTIAVRVVPRVVPPRARPRPSPRASPSSPSSAAVSARSTSRSSSRAIEMVFALASAVAPSVVPRVPRPSVDRARRVDRAFRARRVPRRRASRVPRRRVRAVVLAELTLVLSRNHTSARRLFDIRTPGCFSDRFKSPARRLGVSDVSDDAIARRTSRRARRATGDGRRRRRIATRRDATPATTTRDDDDDDDDARRER
jgi:hypothetical protein